jgi:hypothetical protein
LILAGSYFILVGGYFILAGSYFILVGGFFIFSEGLLIGLFNNLCQKVKNDFLDPNPEGWGELNHVLYT